MGKENTYKKFKTGKLAVTYTAGSAPAVTGAFTIANSATPTVVELLRYIVELEAKVNALVR